MECVVYRFWINYRKIQPPALPERNEITQMVFVQLNFQKIKTAVRNWKSLKKDWKKKRSLRIIWKCRPQIQKFTMKSWNVFIWRSTYTWGNGFIFFPLIFQSFFHHHRGDGWWKGMKSLFRKILMIVYVLVRGGLNDW